MNDTATALAGVTAFARGVRGEMPSVDEGLVALRRLLAAAGVEGALVGGAAVIHHGYVRATEDLHLLVERADLDRLEPLLAAHGFERAKENRLRHVPSGVDVDLLFGGERRPRPGSPPYPRPSEVARSDRESDVVALPALVELKLVARRHQDLADVVELLKRLDEEAYFALEASVPPELRADLLRLRRDALEELSLGES